jgi:hypothetical protein
VIKENWIRQQNYSMKKALSNKRVGGQVFGTEVSFWDEQQSCGTSIRPFSNFQNRLRDLPTIPGMKNKPFWETPRKGLFFHVLANVGVRNVKGIWISDKEIRVI